MQLNAEKTAIVRLARNEVLKDGLHEVDWLLKNIFGKVDNILAFIPQACKEVAHSTISIVTDTHHWRQLG